MLIWAVLCFLGLQYIRSNTPSKPGQTAFILQNPNTLIFIKVKSRSNSYIGDAIYSIQYKTTTHPSNCWLPSYIIIPNGNMTPLGLMLSLLILLVFQLHGIEIHLMKTPFNTAISILTLISSCHPPWPITATAKHHNSHRIIALNQWFYI